MANFVKKVASSIAESPPPTALEEVISDYEFILIDCPPALGLLTVNALCFADEVIV